MIVRNLRSVSFTFRSPFVGKGLLVFPHIHRYVFLGGVLNCKNLESFYELKVDEVANICSNVNIFLTQYNAIYDFVKNNDC